jgi:hypothetical protein
MYYIFDISIVNMLWLCLNAFVTSRGHTDTTNTRSKTGERERQSSCLVLSYLIISWLILSWVFLFRRLVFVLSRRVLSCLYLVLSSPVLFCRSRHSHGRRCHADVYQGYENTHHIRRSFVFLFCLILSGVVLGCAVLCCDVQSCLIWSSG